MPALTTQELASLGDLRAGRASALLEVPRMVKALLELRTPHLGTLIDFRVHTWMDLGCLALKIGLLLVLA